MSSRMGEPGGSERRAYSLRLSLDTAGQVPFLRWPLSQTTSPSGRVGIRGFWSLNNKPSYLGLVNFQYRIWISQTTISASSPLCPCRIGCGVARLPASLSESLQISPGTGCRSACGNKGSQRVGRGSSWRDSSDAHASDSEEQRPENGWPRCPRAVCFKVK